MRALARELGGWCDWCIVYIAEAHATDEWPISSARYNGARGAVCLAQTHTTRARADAARAFARDFGLGSTADARGAHVTLVLDEPEAGEPFSAAYAPWPTRYYVLQRNETGEAGMRFISEPRDSGFIDLAPFRSALLHAAATEIV